ncbi:unnamed protein product [Oppiella nova]|uniref:tRNA-binding domain-containing protein n=1 Tax=Oppiella nova TaxID=334625 RepID=A0A7R9QB39_9ACAR|nr:unnamed protein product [Oppiella nova]CAG2162106.1 unnamed protein product [Oppiella nova]
MFFTTFGPKLVISVLLKTIVSKPLVQIRGHRLRYLVMTSMDKIIDEINTNHIKILSKIRDLEQKIALKERSIEAKATKHVLTAEEINVERQRLTHENKSLTAEVNRLVTTLNELEAKRDPNAVFVCKPTPNGVLSDAKTSEKTPLDGVDNTRVSQKTEKKEKPKKEPKVGANKPSANADDNKPLDVSRLDLRVGRILSAKRHPDADSLYVEDIDCGEEKPRTVVSGLVKFVPLEEMNNRLVVVLCNLKPAKMRGITSEAMVMCASTPEKVEILSPPEGSVPGDRVVFDKYPGTADSQLNPKKKIWEQIAPDLKTDSQCVATYKGEPFKVESKGLVTAKTLSNVVVK